MENRLQQQQLGSGIPKPAQISEVLGHDSEVAIKDGGNGAGLGSNVKGSGSVGDNIWQQYLGGERGDSQVPDGVPPSGGASWGMIVRLL